MTELSQHIVWDWNGTILDDGWLMMNSIVFAFSGSGYEGVTIEEHQRHFRRPISDFFERLARKGLSEEELKDLMDRFDGAYACGEHSAALTSDARRCLAMWAAKKGSQSLLSMCPHEKLQSLVDERQIGEYFTLIEGRTGQGPDTKESYLRNHLTKLGISDPNSVLLVGDTVDDAIAAQSAGVNCIIYHSGVTALQERNHFDHMRVPVVTSLTDALDYASRILESRL